MQADQIAQDVAIHQTIEETGNSKSVEDAREARLRKRRRERRIQKQQRKALDARLKDDLEEAERQEQIRRKELDGLQIDQKFETLSFEFRVDSSCKTEHPGVRGFALEPVTANWDPEVISPIFFGLEAVYEPDNIYLKCPVRVFGITAQDIENSSTRILFQRAVCAVLGVQIPFSGIRFENIQDDLKRKDAIHRMEHKLKRRLAKCIKRENVVQLNRQLVQAKQSVVLEHHIQNIPNGMVSFDLVVDFHMAPALYSVKNPPLPTNYSPLYINRSGSLDSQPTVSFETNPFVDLSFGIREYETRTMKRMSKRLGVAITHGEFAHALAILRRNNDRILSSSHQGSQHYSPFMDKANEEDVGEELPDCNSLFVAKGEEVIQNVTVVEGRNPKDELSIRMIREHKLFWSIDEGCMVLYYVSLSNGSRDWVSRDRLFEMNGGTAALRAYDINKVLEYEAEGIELEVQEELSTFRSELGFANDSSANVRVEGHRSSLKSDVEYKISLSLSQIPEIIERTSADKIELPNDTPRHRRSNALDLQFRIARNLRKQQLDLESSYKDMKVLNHSALTCHPCFWGRSFDRPQVDMDVTKLSPIFFGTHEYLLFPDPLHEDTSITSMHPSMSTLVVVKDQYLAERNLSTLVGLGKKREQLQKGISLSLSHLTDATQLSPQYVEKQESVPMFQFPSDAEEVPFYEPEDAPEEALNLNNSDEKLSASGSIKFEHPTDSLGFTANTTQENQGGRSSVTPPASPRSDGCETAGNTSPSLAPIEEQCSPTVRHPIFSGCEYFNLQARQPSIWTGFADALKEAKGKKDTDKVEELLAAREAEVLQNAHTWHPATAHYCTVAPKCPAFPGTHNPVMFGFECSPPPERLYRAAQVAHPSCVGYRLAQKDLTSLGPLNVTAVSPIFYGYDLYTGPRHDGLSDIEKRKRRSIETSLTADNAFSDPIAPPNVCPTCFGDREQCPRCWSRSELDGETSIDPKGVVDRWLTQNNTANVRKVREQQREQGRVKKGGPNSIARVDQRRKGEAIALAEKLLRAKKDALMSSPAAIAKHRRGPGRFCHVFIKKLPLGGVVDFVVETNRPVRYLYFLYRSIAPKDLSYQRTLHFLLPCETGLFLIDPTVEQGDEFNLPNQIGNCTLEDFGVTSKKSSLCLFQVQSLEHPRAGDIVIKYLTKHLSFASEIHKKGARGKAASKNAPSIGVNNPNNLMLRKRGLNAKKLAAGSLTFEELQPDAARAEAMLKKISENLRDITATLTDRVYNVTEVDDIQLRLLPVLCEISATQEETRHEENLLAAKERQEAAQQRIKDRIKQRAEEKTKQVGYIPKAKSVRVPRGNTTTKLLVESPGSGQEGGSVLPPLRLDQVGHGYNDTGYSSGDS